MSIPLITNFTINQNAPIDDRIVVANSSLRDAITYKYDGLTVFQTDTRSSWTWNATSATWSYNVAGNGIYAGSGSVVGNTYVNLNSISTGAAANTTSNLLGYYSNLTGGSSVYYLNTYAIKKSASPSSQLSFKIQNSLNSTNYSYIEFNPDSSDTGAIAIGNNTIEYLRISNTGNLNLWKGNLILWSPTYSATFNLSGLTNNYIYYLPNKTGTLAMISDVSTLAATVSNLAATVSAISLQTVTNVGATTSRPVTMLSSLSVGSTFSIGSDFVFNNKQEIFYLDSSSYVIYGSAQTSQNSASSYFGGYGYIGDVAVPSNCSIYVEAIYNSSEYHVPVIVGSYTTYIYQTKISASFKVNSSGVISQIGGVSTDYTNNDSSQLQYGTFVITTNNTIKLRQLWTPYFASGYTTYVKLKVHYKIFISSY